MAKTIKQKNVKCRFKNCKHASRELPPDEAVKVNSTYYHKDCFEEKENIEKIKALYVDRINPNVVMSELVRTINNIIYSKHVSSDYLLFALKHYVDRGGKLNYPYGLHYVINNVQEKEAYEKQQRMEASKELKKSSFEVVEDTSSGFTFNHRKNTGFNMILGG